MLKSIGVGPLPQLNVTFTPRVNLITGDSGLGKSFLLDLIFWTFSETWAGGRMALPEVSSDDKTPIFEWNFPGKNDFSRRELSAYFDFNAQVWRRSGGRHAQRSLVVYADSRGSYSVWDPSRNWSVETDAQKSGAYSQPPAYQFDSQSLADGLKDNGRSFCNGIIHDWVNWYYHGSKPGGSRQFKDLEALIELLSPPGLPIKCGEPRHVFADDTREFPTLKMPYGEVAFPHWPAGVARVIGLAYVLVWSWHEHLRAAKQRKEQPLSHLVLLIDDLETHISPAWQRSILMALSRVAKTLDSNMGMQLVASTHSPLTLASLEPHFIESEDALFWLHRAGQRSKWS